MTDQPTRTEADAVSEIVAEHLEPKILDPALFTVGAPHFALLPSGIRIESLKAALDQYRTAPERRKGTARFVTLESFIEHAKRFADRDSAIFADPSPTSPSLTSVLDYHRAGFASDPRFGTHRGVYTFPLSDEWVAWQGMNGKPFGQAEFAEFVENRILDVADPALAFDSAREFVATLGCSFAAPGKLIALSRGLALRVDTRVQNAQNLSTGEVQLQYATQHTDEAGAPLTVPGAFLIAIPVFKEGALYQLPARLRYRHRDGKITWFYELHRADRVFTHAFKEACDQARTETELPLFLGSAEAGG